VGACVSVSLSSEILWRHCNGGKKAGSNDHDPYVELHTGQALALHIACRDLLGGKKAWLLSLLLFATLDHLAAADFLSEDDPCC
jgi:hypothetical protein